MVYVVQAIVFIEVTLCYCHAVLVILVSFRESVAWHYKEQTFPNCALQIETFWINVVFKIPTVTRQASWLCTEHSQGDDLGQPRKNAVSSRCNMKGLNLGLPDYKPTPWPLSHTHLSSNPCCFQAYLLPFHLCPGNQQNKRLNRPRKTSWKIIWWLVLRSSWKIFYLSLKNFYQNFSRTY